MAHLRLVQADPAFHPQQTVARRQPKQAARFVASRLATLPAGTYTDPGQPGLQIRVRVTAQGGTRSWLFRFQFRGLESRILIGHFPETTLEAARALVREYRARASQGIDPRRARPRGRQGPPLSNISSSGSPPARNTIEHLVDDYLCRHARVHQKRPEYVARILRREVMTEWAGRDARTISPTEVISLLDKVVDRGSKVMANRLASVLSQLFRWGIHRNIVDDSPVKLLYRPGGRERPRERALSAREMQILLNVEPLPRWERLHRTINILLLTGQRRGELALAKWNDINLDLGTWRIPDEISKTGRGHMVPLSDYAVEEFKALRRMSHGSAFVFPSQDPPDHPADPKQLTRNLARAEARFTSLGLGRFTLHDLRRTCRTGMARLAVAPHVAERVLNHAQGKIPGTYDLHDYLLEKRAALQIWADHLRKPIP